MIRPSESEGRALRQGCSHSANSPYTYTGEPHQSASYFSSVIHTVSNPLSIIYFCAGESTLGCPGNDREPEESFSLLPQTRKHYRSVAGYFTVEICISVSCPPVVSEVSCTGGSTQGFRAVVIRNSSGKQIFLASTREVDHNAMKNTDYIEEICKRQTATTSQ